MYPSVHSRTVYNRQDMETIQYLSTDDCLKKMCFIYIEAHIQTYIWASLVAQTVKNLPAMQETWVQSPERSPGEGSQDGWEKYQ